MTLNVPFELAFNYFSKPLHNHKEIEKALLNTAETGRTMLLYKYVNIVEGLPYTFRHIGPDMNSKIIIK